ncbi:MAG: lipopolysaccharide heptosyltransferase I [Candidatus Deferrimicrobiaceae bacterium]
MDPSAPRTILVVKLSALGDVVHALPVVDYLGKVAPGAQVDWVVDRRFAGILEGNPGLRRVIPLDLGAWKREWAAGSSRRDAVSAIRLLRKGGYDAAFDIQGNIKSGVVTRLSGAGLRFGFDRSGVRESPNLFFTNRHVRSRPEDVHVTQKILRVVNAPFGGEIPSWWNVPGIVTSKAADNEAARLLGELLPDRNPRLAIHAGTTWNTKKMDPDFWAGVARLLRDRFPQVGVFLSWGTEEEREEAEGIRRLAGEGTRVLPRLALRQLAAVYKVCGYMLGPDTGPLHIAAAAGAKTVSLFRASDGSRTAPYGPTHRFLQAPMPCTACRRKRCDRDVECRKSILLEDAAAAMAQLMEGAP